MDMSKYSGNVFLKVEDIKASGPIQVTITCVSEGRFGRPDLAFNDGTKLSLNGTNNGALLRAYGKESGDWIDKLIELRVGDLKYDGELREGILVKPLSPLIEKKALPPSQFGDEIPF
jgi:hypothetical protein